MKKTLSLLLVASFMLSLFACGNNQIPQAQPQTEAKANTEVKKEALKIGLVCIGDENEGYSFAHIDALRKAVIELGLDEKESLIMKYNIAEDASAYDACVDLAEQGCKLIITNSYSHQKYTQQAAGEYPDVEFCAMTGDTAKVSGLANFHNAFTKIYQGRYIGGAVAGLKLKELIDEGKITDANKDADGKIKIGYVGAYPFAEVVSGYTAFFLGIRSIVPDVAMQVQYTNSWGNMIAEKEAATALINDGCVIIGQHADTTGAPSATEELLNAGHVCYTVGYNVDMVAAAPNAALISPANNWLNYYKYVVKAVMNGEKFDQNWAEGFESDSVILSTPTKNCANGTQEKINELIQKFKSKSLHVFDVNTFTVGGNKVESAFATDTNGDFTPDTDEAVFDGYFHESYFQSAPAFSLRIDGIKELN